MYKRFVRQSEFKKYLHGLNEELGRHRGREGKVECSICGAECM